MKKHLATRTMAALVKQSFGFNMAMVDGGHQVPCFGVHPVQLGDQSTRDAQTMKMDCELCTK